MHPMRSPQHLSPHFGKPDMLDVTGPEQVRDRTDRVFDRHGRVGPRRSIDVDVLGSKPTQCVGEVILDGYGARIHTAPPAGRIPLSSKLDADDHVLTTTAPQRLADEQLVVARAVK